MGILISESNPLIYINSIHPNAVANLLLPELTLEDSKNRYKMKKKLAIDRVEKLISSKDILTKQSCVDYFHACKKKDDLADSLLLSVAFHHWWLRAIENF